MSKTIDFTLKKKKKKANNKINARTFDFVSRSNCKEEITRNHHKLRTEEVTGVMELRESKGLKKRNYVVMKQT